MNSGWIKSVMARYVFMLAIFVVGTAVGLGASWWLRHPTVPGQAVAVKNTRPVSPAPVIAPADTNRAVVVRGISPSELPYDGKPPPAYEGDASSPELAPAARLQEVLPEENPSAKPMPSDVGQSSGASAEEKVDLREEGSAALSAATARIKNEEGSNRSQSRTTDVTTKAVTRPAKAPPSAQAKAKERDEGDAKASKKRAPAKLAKDREIDRIKQEADKELQRKLEVGRAADEARARSQLAASARNKRHAELTVASKTAHVRKVLAKCDRISNLFRREKCKWDLCGNRWGKHGCPSYSRPVNTY